MDRWNVKDVSILFRHDIAVAKDVGQSHRETGRMGRADQLLGVCPFAILKTGVEAVGLFFQNACFGGNDTLAVFQTAAPVC